MTQIDWEARWDACEVALREAAEFQDELGAAPRARELILDFVDQNDFTDALLFGAGPIQAGDDRPRAQELARLLIPQVEYLIEVELDERSDPSPLAEYASTLERLRSAAEATA